MALGILDGDGRAWVIRHLGSCPSCRREVEDLTSVADLLVQAAPAVEPPMGFETAVLDRLTGPGTARAKARGRRRGRRWPAVAAAVAGVAAAVALLAAGVVVGLGRGAEGHRQVGELRDAAGAPVGRVVAEEGHPSFVLVALRPGAPAGDYVVHCVYEGTDDWVAGTMAVPEHVDPAAGFTFSTALPFEPEEISRVELVPVRGGPVLSAVPVPG
jgi:hypothetical protein